MAPKHTTVAAADHHQEVMVVTHCTCYGVWTWSNLSPYVLQLGIALGFVLPASIVRSDKSEEAVELVGGDLYNMFLGVAVFTTALFLVILLGEYV